MSDKSTALHKNRKIRQDALREQLSNQKHVEQVIEITKKLDDANIESKDVTRLKVKADLHLALIKKYIPDLKAIELSGEIEHEHNHSLSDVELAHELASIIASSTENETDGAGESLQAFMETLTRATDGSIKH